MSNKLKAALLTPCVIAFISVLFYTINLAVTGSYGQQFGIGIVVTAAVAMIYMIIYNLLES